MRLLSQLFFVVLLLSHCSGTHQEKEAVKLEEKTNKNTIIPGAYQTDSYLPMLEGKTIAMVVNHTATIGETHLVDSLHALGIKIKMVFSPEHGFRGDADAGEHVKDGVDNNTGIPIKSLYGKTRKPTPEMLENVDLILFDIQDVGARFYTYISTMHRTMEAAAENGIPYLILDRPNPNGNYADGPIRVDSLRSGVGMHPIPIAHGCTVGELAGMINGEGWMNNKIKSDLTVIKVQNYTHQSEYELPIKPSPNLPTQLSIILYPSVCLFEGTAISVGRGTYEAFQQIGHPSLEGKYEYEFTPISIEGMAKNPRYMDEKCYGIDFSKLDIKREFTLKYLIEMYQAFEDKENFFKSYIHKLEGTGKLKDQIINGMSEEEIRKTWEPELSQYREMRKQYLLYDL